jgi:hypothetical protein
MAVPCERGERLAARHVRRALLPCLCVYVALRVGKDIQDGYHRRVLEDNSWNKGEEGKFGVRT